MSTDVNVVHHMMVPMRLLWIPLVRTAETELGPPADIRTLAKTELRPPRDPTTARQRLPQ